MKACVLEGVGNLVYKEVSKPQAGAGEVLLAIKACGICSSDIDRVFKTGTYHFPTIPGHEFAGVVEEVGEGVSSELIGKKAAVFPLLPCRSCPSCQIGEYARCDAYNYFGSRCDGGFAQYLAVPVWNLVMTEKDMPFELMALCEPAAVAFHAVERGELRLGDTAVIVGTGTIAFLTAIFAKRGGAQRVILVGRNEEKARVAEQLQDFIYINSSRQQVHEEVWKLTGQRGADVVFECVGSSEALEQSVQLAKKGGRLVLMGNPTGDMKMERNCYWKILRNELIVAGTWNSSYNIEDNNWQKALAVLGEEQERILPLITQTFSLEQHEEAFECLRSRDIMTLKVMFRI